MLLSKQLYSAIDTAVDHKMWCRFIFSIAALTVMLLPFDATATVVIDRVPTETTDSMLRSTCSTKQKEKKGQVTTLHSFHCHQTRKAVRGTNRYSHC